MLCIYPRFMDAIKYHALKHTLICFFFVFFFLSKWNKRVCMRKNAFRVSKVKRSGSKTISPIIFSSKRFQCSFEYGWWRSCKDDRVSKRLLHQYKLFMSLLLTISINYILVSSRRKNQSFFGYWSVLEIIAEVNLLSSCNLFCSFRFVVAKKRLKNIWLYSP